MNEPTNVQIIEQNGKPVFAVIPYDDYLNLVSDPAEITIPHNVVSLVIDNDWNLAKAWRKHLKLTQKEVAAKAGITQAALSQMERAETNNHTATIGKLALAMGISVDQLKD